MEERLASTLPPVFNPKIVPRSSLAVLMARLATDAPRLDIRLGATVIGANGPVLTPTLMYAGVRG